MSDSEPGPDTESHPPLEHPETLPNVPDHEANPFEVAIPLAARMPSDLSTQPPGPFQPEAPSLEDPLITPIRNMVRGELAKHEQKEAAIAEATRKHVDQVEQKASAERAETNLKIDRLTIVVESIIDPQLGLPAVFREAAASIANPFLERDDERRRQVETLQKEITDLKTEFMATRLAHERRIEALERDLAQLKPKSVES